MCSAPGKKVPEAEPDDNLTICKKRSITDTDASSSTQQTQSGFTSFAIVIDRHEMPAGEHFSKKNHTTMDMIFLPLERVLPQGDDILRKTRETVWIRNYNYDATTFGKNSRP